MAGTGVRRTLPPGVVLAVVCVAAGLLPTSATGTALALPEIGAQLQVGLSDVNWVLNGFNVMFASFMLAAGSLSDLLGRRRLFVAGIALFAVCSLGSGLVTDIHLLNGLRAVAGIGAAAVLTAGSATLPQVFEGPALAKAFGLFGSVFGVGLALGPTSSGLLLDAFGWQSIFLTHGAIALLVLSVAWLLPESRDPQARGVDWPGTLTFTGGLFLFALGLVQGPQLGWASPAVLGMFGGAVLILALFAVVEKRQSRPMFDLALFRQGRFVAVCLMPVLLAFGFVCLLVFLPTYFIGVNQMGSTGAGAMMLLLTVPVLVVPVIAGALSRRVPISFLLALSLVLVGAGAAWLTVIQPDSGWLEISGPMLVIGIGVGVSWGLLDGAAVGSVKPERAGMAAGMFNTTRLASEAMAIAGMGSVLVSLTQSRIAAGFAEFTAAGAPDATAAANQVAQGDIAGLAQTVPEGPLRQDLVLHVSAGYTDALHVVLWILAAVCVAGTPLILALLRTRRTAAQAEAPDTAPAADPDSGEKVPVA